MSSVFKRRNELLNSLENVEALGALWAWILGGGDSVASGYLSGVLAPAQGPFCHLSHLCLSPYWAPQSPHPPLLVFLEQTLVNPSSWHWGQARWSHSLLSAQVQMAWMCWPLLPGFLPNFEPPLYTALYLCLLGELPGDSLALPVCALRGILGTGTALTFTLFL